MAGNKRSKCSICIVITSHNLADRLEKCLVAITKAKYLGITIIIVDNGSNPPLKKIPNIMDKITARVTVLRQQKNLGFAISNNIGIEYGLKHFPQTDYFLLLNNDANILPSFFTKSLPYLFRGDVLLSPVVTLTGNRGVDSMGLDYYSDGSASNRKKKRKEKYLLPATCLFVEKNFAVESYRNFGWLFVPVFVSYAEDVELSLRTVLMGKKIFLIPEEIVYHEKSATMKDSQTAIFLGKRNLFWTVIICWPNTMIRKYLYALIRGFLINAVILTLKYRNLIMLKIILNTLSQRETLLSLRKKVQQKIILENPENLILPNPLTLINQIKNSRTIQNLIPVKQN